MAGWQQSAMNFFGLLLMAATFSGRRLFDNMGWKFLNVKKSKNNFRFY